MNVGSLKGKDGTTRTFYHWEPASDPKAIVVLSHGYAEHAGRYAEMAAKFNQSGFDVWAIDHYGHGQSEGKRAEVDDFNLFPDDLHLFIHTQVLPSLNSKKDKNERHTAQLPLFLYGHSMGGSIALLYTLKHQSDLTGIVLSGPMVRPGAVSTSFERTAAHILRKIVPSLPFRPFSADYLSHDANEVQTYKDDPLNYIGKMKIRLGDEYLRMEEQLSDEALATITLPVLLLHGGDDIVVPPENSLVVMENISSNDKNRIVYPGLYHEIHKEAERDSVFNTIIEWIEKRI